MARTIRDTHAGGDEHHVSAGQVVADLVDHLFGGGTTDIGLGARTEPFGRSDAHLDDAFGPRLAQSLGVRVGDDKIDALEPCIDHVVQGVTARAADTKNGDPRLQLADVRNFAHTSPLIAQVGITKTPFRPIFTIICCPAIRCHTVL
jgi:hypothetical protein